VLAFALAAPASRAHASDAYSSQIVVSAHQLTASLEGLGAVAGMSIEYPIKPATGRRAAAKLALVEATLRQTGKTLAAMHPPARVRAQHVRLATAVVALGNAVAPILARVRAGYLVAAAQLPNLRAAARVGEALTALQKAGYHVG
jgi:hypothetical protein